MQHRRRLYISEQLPSDVLNKLEMSLPSASTSALLKEVDDGVLLISDSGSVVRAQIQQTCSSLKVNYLKTLKFWPTSFAS